jgi:hypothetical protein
MDIILLPKRCPERMAKLQRLANEGNFKHNASAIAYGSGEVVVGRRNSTACSNPDKFLPCEFCHKFLSKGNLWRHLRTCSARVSESVVEVVSSTEPGVKPPTRQCAVARSRWVLNGALYQQSEACFVDLMNRMRDDNLKKVAMNDALIRRYAILLMQSLGRKEVQKHNDVHRVSQSARLLARIVEESRKRNSAMTMDDLIRPQSFDLVVEIACNLSFDKSQQALNVGRSAGLLLNHVTLVKNDMALRSGDQQKSADALNFRKLHKAEWNYRVNSPAVKCINARKRNKQSAISLTQDLQKQIARDTKHENFDEKTGNMCHTSRLDEAGKVHDGKTYHVQ